MTGADLSPRAIGLADPAPDERVAFLARLADAPPRVAPVVGAAIARAVGHDERCASKNLDPRGLGLHEAVALVDWPSTGTRGVVSSPHAPLAPESAVTHTSRPS